MTVARGELQVLSLHPETTFGTRIGDIGFTEIPHNSESLVPTRQWFESGQAVGDRQVADGRLGRHSTTGDITSELVYANHDRLLEQLLCNYKFTPNGTVAITGTTIAAVDAGNKLTDSGNGFVTAGFYVGQTVLVGGFTGTPANNGTYVVASVAAGELGLVGSGLADDAASEQVTVLGSISLTATTIAAVASGNKLTDSGNGFVTAGFEVGQRVTVSGFTGTTANNTTYWVVSVSAGELALSGNTLVDDAASESVTVALAKPAFQVVTSAAQTLDAVTSGNLFTGGDPNAFNDFAAGDYIYVTGFANAANNGFFKVTGADSGGAYITVAGATLVDETILAAGGGIIRQVDLTNGTTELFSTIHKKFVADTGTLDEHDVLGAVVTQGALTIPANGIATMTWSFLGKQHNTAADAVSLVDQTKYSPFDGLSGSYKIGGVASTSMTAFSMTIANGHTPTECLGTRYMTAAIPRKFRVTGSLTVYHTGYTELARLLDETETDLTVTMTDPAGNAHVVVLPRVKFTSGGSTKTDDGPVMETINFTALKDQDVTDVTIAWVFIPA